MYNKVVNLNDYRASQLGKTRDTTKSVDTLVVYHNQYRSRQRLRKHFRSEANKLVLLGERLGSKKDNGE